MTLDQQKEQVWWDSFQRQFLLTLCGLRSIRTLGKKDRVESCVLFSELIVEIGRICMNKGRDSTSAVKELRRKWYFWLRSSWRANWGKKGVMNQIFSAEALEIRKKYTNGNKSIKKLSCFSYWLYSSRTWAKPFEYTTSNSFQSTK